MSISDISHGPTYVQPWQGVTCSQTPQVCSFQMSHITEIRLALYRMRGFIPPEIGNLPFLHMVLCIICCTFELGHGHRWGGGCSRYGCRWLHWGMSLCCSVRRTVTVTVTLTLTDTMTTWNRHNRSQASAEVLNDGVTSICILGPQCHWGGSANTCLCSKIKLHQASRL